jgi:hypothetical protein
MGAAKSTAAKSMAYEMLAVREAVTILLFWHEEASYGGWAADERARQITTSAKPISHVEL